MTELIFFEDDEKFGNDAGNCGQDKNTSVGTLKRLVGMIVASVVAFGTRVGTVDASVGMFGTRVGTLRTRVVRGERLVGIIKTRVR